MAGVNRASGINVYLSESRKNSGIKCVFLSHQKSDSEICKRIAAYLMAADIDIYFDENDADLKFSRQTNNPQGIVDSIKKGINKSSHMLVVVSPSTIKSQWVPWEVGYGFDNSILGVLTLKGIQESNLEAYLKTAPIIIRGTKSLNEYISSISGSYVSSMESVGRIKAFNQTHPLDDYLDWNQ